MGLPTAKTPAQPRVGKVFIFAEPKVGKSLLSMMLDPEHTIALDIEDGLHAIEGYKHRVTSWGRITGMEGEGRNAQPVFAEDSFRGTIKMLHEQRGEHPFKIATIDTADALASLCSEYVLTALGQSIGEQGYVHASDFDYGKGWDAINKEWQLRVGALARVMDSVILISHADRKIKKSRTGAEIPVYTPALAPAGIRKWTLGFVDHILFMDVDENDQGETMRVLHTQPSVSWEAGSRSAIGGTSLPEPIWLPDPVSAGPTLHEALKQVAAPVAAPAQPDELDKASPPAAKKPAARKPAAKKTAEPAKTPEQEQLDAVAPDGTELAQAGGAR